MALYPLTTLRRACVVQRAAFAPFLAYKHGPFLAQKRMVLQ